MTPCRQQFFIRNGQYGLRRDPIPIITREVCAQFLRAIGDTLARSHPERVAMADNLIWEEMV